MAIQHPTSPTADVQESGQSVYKWIIVGIATLCLLFGFGANITVTVFINPLEQEFEWSRTAVSSAYSILAVGAAIGGILWGMVSDRLGSKPVAFFGATSLSVSFILLSYQNNLLVIYVLYFFIGFCGFACLFAPILALTGRWFNRGRGLAIGIVTAGGTIGQGGVPYLVQLWIDQQGWREASFQMGIMYAVALLLPLILLKEPNTTPLVEENPAAEAPPEGWAVPHRVSLAWLSMAGVFCCVCMAVPLIHLVPLGISICLSPGQAAELLVVLMASGTVGRIFFGFVADRIGGLPAYLMASFLQSGFVFWFTQTEDLPTLFLISLLFGFSFSGVMTGLLISTSEAVPRKMAGLAVGLVSAFGWFGMGIGASMGGYLFDIFGNYSWSFGASALLGMTNVSIVAALYFYVDGHCGRTHT
ncbi:MFS transporter [Leisingera methylohalidivorans]|uniref:Major facilitator superfamily (MFS) profile domain-containing protein n=1 Tax=Leisingera methylohalidivorans DSM 14336 TaxID=999552 RepID=V9VWT1_9RHOB|nr:MFS transporter [Leisingera methylohalidivorans]AHD03221.1 hypothetical protein METH_16970 [Leisingera methylohalidivorans DSM 14336]